MNTQTSGLSFLRSVMVVATLMTASTSTFASEADATCIRNAIVIPNGPVRVTAAGPYVELGTYRVQVSAKLGLPAIVLADGSWLYRGFRLGESSIRGSLLVRFDRNCVSELRLIPNATVAALQAQRGKSQPAQVAATGQGQE